MALGFLEQLASDAAVAWSGGSKPGIEVNPTAVAAMTERAPIWSRTDEAVDHCRRKVPEMEEGGVHRALDRHSCPSHGT